MCIVILQYKHYVILILKKFYPEILFETSHEILSGNEIFECVMNENKRRNTCMWANWLSSLTYRQSDIHVFTIRIRIRKCKTQVHECIPCIENNFAVFMKVHIQYDDCNYFQNESTESNSYHIVKITKAKVGQILTNLGILVHTLIVHLHVHVNIWFLR